VLIHLTAHIEDGFPAFSSGLWLFDVFYSVWQAVIFAAGAALIIISWEIKKGTEWTYPLAVTLFAVPAIGGFFMFLPYISWVPGFPLPMTIAFIGLTGFWAFIFLRKAETMVKWTRFGALTFIGMLTTHAFTIGIGAQRTMATRPGFPMYPDFTWWLFRWPYHYHPDDQYPNANLPHQNTGLSLRFTAGHRRIGLLDGTLLQKEADYRRSA
jgi:hypothetical protein